MRQAAPDTPLKPSVLVLQRILPPYRVALFRGLAASPGFSLRLAYGQPSAASALESVAAPPGVRTLPLRNIYGGADEAVVVQRGVARLLASGGYDTLIAEFNPRILSNVWAAWRARRLGMRVIWWGHGLRPRTSGPALRAYLALSRLADGFVFYSDAGADRFAALGEPREKLFVAWNSVDTQEIERLRRETPLAGRHRVLGIGRLIAPKKNDLLLRAFAQARPALPPQTRLTLIGDGPERAALAALATHLGIAGSVEFAGSLYGQEALAAYFNESWVSVSAGYVGLSAVHSLAYGVPMLVARDEPHSPEIAAVEPGVNARLFPSDDPAALAGALAALAADPAGWASQSAASVHTVRERFSIGAMVRSFEETIRYVHRPQGGGEPGLTRSCR